MSHKFPGLAIVLIGALALVACSSDDSTEAAPKVGPLEEYLQPLGDTIDQDALQRAFNKQEDLVAVCMTEQGFEYTPNAGAGMSISLEEDDAEQEGPAWGSLEFAKEFGYGIVSSPRTPDTENSTAPPTDPNAEYLESLSENQREAFNLALNGEDQMPEDGNFDDWEYDLERAGCVGAAQLEVQQDPAFALFNSPEMEALQESQAQLYQDVESAPDTLAAVEDWSSCMADAGYPNLSVRSDSQQQLSDRYTELNAPNGEGNSPKELSKEEKQQFQDEEIEMATADYTCADEVDFDKRQQKVQFELEQTYVEEHKAELDALLAKVAAEKK
ncbi:hypothetical protein [Leucobacter sp. M11]|uniref:hypothetical protein n=1 Tax=Leucobacter sp. M11 TaxID=2993565 RepID=UPI002D7F69CB|nr:hypothetical protein [Leucobacter sp. M11]MEB4614165.1 hypothetical protein [Leucobacter sp. M11]